jgi:hypothetical protein
MIKDGTYEVENAELIAKTHVRLVSLQEMEGLLRSAGYGAIKVYRKRRSDWNAILSQKT